MAQRGPASAIAKLKFNAAAKRIPANANKHFYSVAGHRLSKHALQRMIQRNLPRSVIEQAVKSGVPKPGNAPNTIRKYDAVNDVSVVLNSKTKTIITVRRGD